MTQHYITLAAKQDDAGSLVAYASVYDVRSEQGIIIRQGAFAPYLKQLSERGYLLWQHDIMTPPIGMIVQAVEDNVGLLITCEWHSTDDAQAKRTIVAERLQRGLFVGVSIGFYPVRYEYADDGATLIVHEADIRECSIVLYPDNPEARVLVAQSMQQALHNAADIATEAVASLERCRERVEAIKRLRARKGKSVSQQTTTELQSLSQQLQRIATAASSLADDVTQYVSASSAQRAERERLYQLVQQLTSINNDTQRNQ